MNYYSGTSAYKIDYDTYTTSSAYELEYEQIDRQYDNKRATRRKAREKQKAVIAMMVIISLFATLLCSVGFLYSRVMVIYAANKVVSLENELASITAQNSRKSMEIERSIDLKKVEELAISKYNMQRPDKNQTVYVNVAQEDYAEVVKTGGFNFLKKTTGKIKDVLAYLN